MSTRDCESAAMEIRPTSLVTRAEPARQRVEVEVVVPEGASGVVLRVFRGRSQLAETPLGDLIAGSNDHVFLLPMSEEACELRWVLRDGDGRVLSEIVRAWAPPRAWTLYMIASTHTDIGLHNSPYIQRHSNVENVEKAAALIDETAARGDDSCYRYVMEGTWVWGNYERDRGEEAARGIVERYVKPGKMGIGAATAGNHTQVYGFEELCRSAYTRRALRDRWGVCGTTMTMIDNNGLSWALVGPYADAGFRNVFFAPNQWNPIDSTVVAMDKTMDGARCNPAARGGGSRVDVHWDSELPMVFYWQGADDASRLLVWASTQYAYGGLAFGVPRNREQGPVDPEAVAPVLAGHLAKLEARYPYDVWLFANYSDDEVPNLYLADFAAAWNAEWRSPTFRLVGNLDEPFDRLRSRFGEQIQTLRGDITSGWSQHPVCTPELLAQKFAADRLLPTAEKLASLARMFDPSYVYPATAFARAWDALICNDEHSYGVSGYQGRRVYETWMQHRDWIDKAERTAVGESRRALDALAGRIAASEESVVVFNPTLVPRVELLSMMVNGREAKVLTPEVPSLGYVTIPCSDLVAEEAEVEMPEEPPVLENAFYRVAFAADGSIAGILDKELGRELLDEDARFNANQFVYTKDNHETFTSPEDATFEIRADSFGQTVVVRLEDAHSRAAIEQRVTLPNHEKRIEIENRLSHVRDLFNTNRYYRYGYYAFPFEVEEGTFRAQLNGCVASPKTDQTGHGTDVYLPARDWTCVENGEFGVALLQLDSHLVEFGRIHPDKTEFGEPFESSHLYSYIFADWLQMHTTGGSAINPRFRYVITSYSGDYRTAGLSQLAERLTQPLLSTVIPAQDGSLPEGGMGFLSVDQSNVNLLALKQVEAPGEGFIARFHEMDGERVEQISVRQSLGDFEFAACSLLEDDVEDLVSLDVPLSAFGYATVRMHGKGDREQNHTADSLSCDDTASPGEAESTSVPAKVGSFYSGLIDVPRAGHGAEADQLYLIWGLNTEADLSHYELYRSEEPGFTPDAASFVGEIEPGPYCVGRRDDRGLKTFTTYYYRVRAVNTDGQKGEFSDEFSGTTREPYDA